VRINNIVIDYCIIAPGDMVDAEFVIIPMCGMAGSVKEKHVSVAVKFIFHIS